jgi:alpha-glucosidase (family GH31 glycosyl hydrolase)
VSTTGKTFTLAPVVASKNVPGGLELTYKLDATEITALLSFPSDGVMRYEVTDWNGLVAKETSLTVLSDVTEQFYGFGEKFNALNQSGKLIRTETIDNPGTKGEQSYKVAPWFVSTRGYGFHFDSSADSRFDMRATHADRYVVNCLFSTLRFNLVYGPNWHWPGDNEPNFGANGLPSVMVAGLSAAMSGYSIWGHDIGGYQNSNFGTSSADRADLFIRWTQFACFSPIMQMHRQVLPQKRQDFRSGKTEELRQYPWKGTGTRL